MQINTKYNIGDSLYFVENNKIVSREICGVNVEIFKVNECVNEFRNKFTIVYKYLKYPKEVMGENPILYVNEEDAFITKQELIEKLML